MRSARVVVVGAGIGGLAAAVELAAGGCDVVVCEAAQDVGGKLRQIAFDGHAGIDCGPTVFTMRWIFEDLFAVAGHALDAHLKLERLDLLARHVWGGGDQVLDLFADEARTVDAIAAFAGPGEGARYRTFSRAARDTFDTLDLTYMRATRPNVADLVFRIARSSPTRIASIHPFQTLARALTRQFDDPRLRQLFGRYATYCGSSPFLAPATLMLIAHAEARGVWLVEGGMKRVAVALSCLAQELGARVRTATPVSEIVTGGGGVTGVRLASGEFVEADRIVFNGDVNALASGLVGDDCRDPRLAIDARERSQSAVTWSMIGRCRGVPLAPHTVFFGPDYQSEFKATFDEGRTPRNPTVYIHAPDRAADGSPASSTPPAEGERLFALINAPADGDLVAWGAGRRAAATREAFGMLERSGLAVETGDGACVQTTPREFAERFPGTGGALYGRASHGWQASFRRPGSRTRVQGLYLAGGSAHPGAGVPMAAMSGRLAAAAVLGDLAKSRTVVAARSPASPQPPPTATARVRPR